MTSNIKMKLALILGSTLLLLLATVGATFYTARLQEGDAVVINIAGRQRMLSQKTIKETYTISLSESEKAAEYRKKLRKTVDLFEKSIHGLKDGDIELGLPPTTNPEILAQINKVHDIWAGIHESAEIIITVEDKTDKRYLSAIEFLGAKNEDLLHEVDKVVQMYEMAASQKVRPAADRGSDYFRLIVGCNICYRVAGIWSLYRKASPGCGDVPRSSGRRRSIESQNPDKIQR